MLTRSDSCRKFDKLLSEAGALGFTAYSPKSILSGHYFLIGGGSWVPQSLGATETEAKDSVLTIVERARLEALQKKERSVQERAKAEAHALLLKNLAVKTKEQPVKKVEEDEEELEVLEEAREEQII